jgi:hypothetical protein
MVMAYSRMAGKKTIPPAPPSFAEATAGKLEKDEPRRSDTEKTYPSRLFLPPEKTLRGIWHRA